MLCENQSAFGKVRGNQSKDIFPNTNRTQASETDLDPVRELDSVMEFGLDFTHCPMLHSGRCAVFGAGRWAESVRARIARTMPS